MTIIMSSYGQIPILAFYGFWYIFPYASIHGKYSLWFIQELKNNQMLATEWPKGDLSIYVSDV